MAYNNRAMLAMIASALNPADSRTHGSHIVCQEDLAEIEATPDRSALIFMMADGTQFKITSEEVI